MSLSSGRTHTSTGPAAASVTALRSPSSSSNDQDNPFAPPPEDAPEQPWRPRTPPQPGQEQGGGSDGRDGGRAADEGSGPRDPWGRGRPGGGFGGLGGPRGQGPRFDITDPVQRRARYSLLSGMWAFFFSLFGIPQIALLLGALALYWGITSARSQARGANGQQGGGATGEVGDGRPGTSGLKPHRAAAVSGIVAGSTALAMVAGLFAMQLTYRDYFECREDALTSKAREACSEQMPEWLRPWAGSVE